MPLFLSGFSDLSCPPNDFAPAVPQTSRPGLFQFSSGRRVINPIAPRDRCEQGAASRSIRKGEIMSKETLKLIASLITKGQAKVIRKGGKLMVVSPL